MDRRTLSIRSNPAAFPDARSWLRDLAEEAGYPRRAVLDLELALTEACTNVYRHGYGRRTDGRIDLSVELDDEAVRLTVRDFGARFDRDSYRPPRLEQPTEGGYGVYLIRELMDEVRYPETKVGTCVVMVKRRPAAAVATAAAGTPARS